MRRRVWALLLCAATACDPHSTDPDVLYVSPTGNDAGPGTHEQPFRTLDRARREIRTRNQAMTADLIVRLEPGDYELAAPLELTAEDSGFNGFKVIYESAEGPDTVRLLGGTRISQWAPFAGPIMAAKVAPDATFHTLYEDGVRADEARYPNREMSPAFPTAHAPYLVSAGAPGSHSVLDYGANQLPDLTDELAGLRVFIWSNAGRAWFTDVVPVREISTSSHQITLAEDTRYEIGSGSRFFIQGAASLLDAPGEFFLDRASSTVYYWPRQPITETTEIVAPRLTTLVTIRGASDLQFRGLRFEATDFTDWYRFGVPDGGFERQIEMPANRRGMITLENTERVEILFSHLVNAGYGGIYLLFDNRDARIYGNAIEHVGINGITLQGRYPGQGDVLRDNIIANNLIHHVGEMVGNAAGIDVSNSGYNTLTNNSIHDSPRFGIVIHAIANTSGDELYAHGNVVERTEIARSCQDSGDGAALYVFGLSEDGTTPRQNTFHQLVIDRATADPSMRDLAPNGVFTDNDTGRQLFENIEVVDVVGEPYRTNEPAAQSFDNVSWLPAFDARKLDRSEIGLRDDFPAEYLSEP